MTDLRLTEASTSAPIVSPPTPAGLESLYSLCRAIYPDQNNPLQVTALVKYWLGGPDPLDYISMYANPGDPEKNIPPHWHYISFGLSDLHGDGRVHELNSELASGFGFELTFRLKREITDAGPPTWPATLMQSLAKYVFRSMNQLCMGDHVSWHCPLDNNTTESRIQHMLMTEDLQLGSANRTPFGNVDFVQIVGVCADELQAAQQWNGLGVLNILKKNESAGGEWLITDMRRKKSIFELDSSAHEQVNRGFAIEGSNLSGVSARCMWLELNSSGKFTYPNEDSVFLGDYTSASVWEDPIQLRAMLQRSLAMSQSHNWLKASQASDSSALGEQLIRKIPGVHLIFNLEAGSLLPLAIRGRVKHGRHFTFKSVLSDNVITLVASTVTGTVVDNSSPYAVQGSWLQVLIPDAMTQKMASNFDELTKVDALTLPKTFSWPEIKLMVTVISDKHA